MFPKVAMVTLINYVHKLLVGLFLNLRKTLVILNSQSINTDKFNQILSSFVSLCFKYSTPSKTSPPIISGTSRKVSPTYRHVWCLFILLIPARQESRTTSLSDNSLFLFSLEPSSFHWWLSLNHWVLSLISVPKMNWNCAGYMPTIFQTIAYLSVFCSMMLELGLSKLHFPDSLATWLIVECCQKETLGVKLEGESWGERSFWMSLLLFSSSWL